MSSDVRIVSSMATRRLLADLVDALAQASPDPRVSVESVGGVDAAKRVAAGEAFDVVVLASGALEGLIGKRHIVQGSRVDLVKSPMAIAVPSGAPHPPIGTEEAVKQAVMSARKIGYSTGPSGDHLIALLDRWGIAALLKERLVQARPGIPVGSLVASREVEIGFQQLSELQHAGGIDLLGLLPAAIEGTTTFSGGVTKVSTQPDRARAVLEFMASPSVADIKRANGMEPA